MLCRFLALLILTSGPASAEGLRADEAALSELLRVGALRAETGIETARLSAARGALALARGQSDAAADYFGKAGELASDCLLRARLAELGRGEGCAELRAGQLEPALLEAPVVFLIVAARPEETGSAFPAAVIATALKALAPAGGLSIESSADRFRVSGSAALEGLWYLEDRLLLSARSAPGRGDSEAGEALEAFLVLRPSGASVAAPFAPPPQAGGPPDSARGVAAHGVEFDLPPGWTSAAFAGAWLAPGASPGEPFPPREGALALTPQPEQQRAESRRNPLARRRPTGETLSPFQAALPEGAELIASHRLGGDGLSTLMQWRTQGGGDGGQSLVRILELSGASVLVVAHLGEALTEAQALELLGKARAVRR